MRVYRRTKTSTACCLGEGGGGGREEKQTGEGWSTLEEGEGYSEMFLLLDLIFIWAISFRNVVGLSAIRRLNAGRRGIYNMITI